VARCCNAVSPAASPIARVPVGTARFQLVPHRDLGAGPNDPHCGARRTTRTGRQWVENYQRMRQDLESISAINRELLRRKRPGSQKSN
jgi:hypothetical protein